MLPSTQFGTSPQILCCYRTHVPRFDPSSEQIEALGPDVSDAERDCGKTRATYVLQCATGFVQRGGTTYFLYGSEAIRAKLAHNMRHKQDKPDAALTDEEREKSALLKELSEIEDKLRSKIWSSAPYQHEPKRLVYVKRKKNGPKSAALDPNYSHMLLVDAAAQSFGDEIPFRVQLESLIRDDLHSHGVQIVLQGGPGTIALVHNAVKDNCPIVLIKESGGMASLLCDLIAELIPHRERLERDPFALRDKVRSNLASPSRLPPLPSLR